MVYAADLSTPSILDGIRAGHVFIDLAGKRDRMLEVSARANDRMIQAGDSLELAGSEPIRLEAHVTGAQGGTLRWIEDCREIASPSGVAIDGAVKTITLIWTSDGHRHWLCAEVAGTNGKLWLIAIPIYINWAESNNCR